MHINWKLKTTALCICLSKFEVKWLTSYWPSLTSDDLKNFEHVHDVYQKKKLSRKDIICDKLFAVLDDMTSHDPELTSNYLNWPPELKNNSQNRNVHKISVFFEFPLLGYKCCKILIFPKSKSCLANATELVGLPSVSFTHYFPL